MDPLKINEILRLYYSNLYTSDFQHSSETLESFGEHCSACIDRGEALNKTYLQRRFLVLWTLAIMGKYLVWMATPLSL